MDEKVLDSSMNFTSNRMINKSQRPEKSITNSTKALKRSKSYKFKNSDKTLMRSSTRRPSQYMNPFTKFKFIEKINNEEKFNINQKGIIELAQLHSLANRPLKTLKDPPPSNIIYCNCCALPCITPGVYETFKVCDDTDTYSTLGEAISLYFSFYKFSIMILFITFCALFVPSFYMATKYYSSLHQMCQNFRDNNYEICQEHIENKDDNSQNDKIDITIFLSQLNAVNLINYIDLYNSMMIYNSSKTERYGKIMDKIIINNSISYFIILITLFIINILYIIFQNNKILEYNFRLISPSDYAILISNMSEVYNSFNQMKLFHSKDNKISDEYYEILGFSDSDLSNKNNITEAKEFSAFIKKFVINKNEIYNVETINISYKLREFKKFKKEVDKYNDYLFELENNETQIKKNRLLNLHGNKRLYFHSFLPEFLVKVFDFFGFGCDFCFKKIKIIDILKNRREKEDELNKLLEQSNFISENNFSNVAFISFSTISEQEKFLKKYSRNFFQKLIYFFKLIFLNIHNKCCKRKKNELFTYKEITEFIEVTPAPEPDDIIFENLDTTNISRFFLVLLTTLVSFLIIAISFIIVVLLTMAQEKIKNLSFGEKNFSKYAVSLAMTGIISIVNIILEVILEILTKKEHHISLTNFNLSFSVKLTICTFVNSGIVPLISNICANLDKLEIDYDLLLSNMLMLFIVNRIISPLLWTFNAAFYLNKIIIWKLEKKKNNQNMSQKKLNELYEYMDIKLAYKYSYLAKTLLMTFFYLPLFPLGMAFSIFGLLLGFYLEKFNMGNRYKRPEMMNHIICKFYTNCFEVNFLMLALGDYIFLKNKYKTNYWTYINLFLFLLFLVIPFGPYLKINLLEINQSKINKQTYNEVYIKFYTVYERINPFTIKEGRIKFLESLKNLNYLSEEEFKAKKKRIEKMSFLSIISEAKPKRVNKLIGKKRGLLSNININESNTTPKRLFELVKKLIAFYNIQKEKEKKKKNEISTINEEEKEQIKIPNILKLCGIIFGTEEDEEEKEDNEEEEKKEEELKKHLSPLKETESEINESNSLGYFSDKNPEDYFKEKINKNKSPFTIMASLQNKNDNNENQNIINKKEVRDLENNENNEIINNDNLDIQKKEDEGEINRITEALKNEINSGKKNLIKYSDWLKEKEKEANKRKNQEPGQRERKINNIHHFNSSKVVNNRNNLKIIKNNGNISYFSNISVTINQFFNRPRGNQNIRYNDLGESNKIMNENEKEDNKMNNTFKINTENIIPLMKEDKENPEINKRPINNIINIVLSNDNNNNNININNSKDDKSVDKVFVNEYINVK